MRASRLAGSSGHSERVAAKPAEKVWVHIESDGEVEADDEGGDGDDEGQSTGDGGKRDASKSVESESDEEIQSDANSEGITENSPQSLHPISHSPFPPRTPPSKLHTRPHMPAPLMEEAADADEKLESMLRPPRKTGRGHKPTELDPLTFKRLSEMQGLLRFFTSDGSQTQGKWIESSLQAAILAGRRQSYGKVLRRWCQHFIETHEVPQNTYGAWNVSVLHTDEDLRASLTEHIRAVGKYFSAEDVVKYVSEPDIMKKMARTRPISVRTARRWLDLMGYKWRGEKKGQYVDGHEREDVVKYRQEYFLPQLAEWQLRTRKYNEHGEEEEEEEEGGEEGERAMVMASERQNDGNVPGGMAPPAANLNSPPISSASVSIPDAPRAPRIVIWWHDESIFYAHDRRKICWVHCEDSAKPYAKGEGQSLMVAHFVSADYGWLEAQDGRTAMVQLKPGKNRDGYFTNDDVLEQVTNAINLLNELYPNDQHVFVFDNATTHSKRADDALSAWGMPKGTQDWLISLCELSRRERSADPHI